MERLNLKEINEAIEKVKDWNLEANGKAIEKEFTFNNFTEALGFVNVVGKIANAENHHPDILIFSYKRVRITLSTHNIEGLSKDDFIVAKKIDELL